MNNNSRHFNGFKFVCVRLSGNHTHKVTGDRCLVTLPQCAVLPPNVAIVRIIFVSYATHYTRQGTKQ